jgi:hypothetical protein
MQHLRDAFAALQQDGRLLTLDMNQRTALLYVLSTERDSKFGAATCCSSLDGVQGNSKYGCEER